MFSPGMMKTTRFVQLPMKLPAIKFRCLCDVRNYFFGENGAVRVFGPQKGLKEDQVTEFESGTRGFFELLKKRSAKDSQDQPGFGAAGGIAMGLDLFFQTELNYGSAYFFDRVNLSQKLQTADWVITGEGRYDSQSREGKACYELLQLAKSNGKKIALITSGKEGYAAGFDLVLELPSLDFSDVDLKNKAHENLHRLLDSVISEGSFDRI
jgi:glycerate kinase